MKQFLIAALIVFGLISISAFLVIGKRSESRPNVVLISIDTLRADHFTPEHMPRLWAFAKRNCRTYANAHASSTWTKPSHVTMLTGMLQSEHGVELHSDKIPSDMKMVQAELKTASYRTVAFVGGGYVSKEWGFDRGFDSFWELPTLREEPEIINYTFGELFNMHGRPFKKARQWIGSHLGQRENDADPLFVFVQSYLVHEYWRKYFKKDSRMFLDDVPKNGSDISEDTPFEELAQHTIDVTASIYRKFHEQADAEDRRRLYGAAAKDCDELLMDFVDFLLASSLSKNLYIIITSDHGEGLADIHNDYTSEGHSGPPYTDQIDIPLIVYGTGTGTSQDLVGLVDIRNAILRITGARGKRNDSIFEKRTNLMAEYRSQSNAKKTARSLAVITDEGKYLLTPDGNLRFFRDPNDSHDLYSRDGEPPTESSISEGLANQLKALGYLD